MKPLQDFNTSTVALQGSNIIEASAGTGKTYSIAILVLRLLLEKKIPVKEILMVTFTKMAVAELEERIRQFIYKAHKASMGEPCKDELIVSIVKQAGDADEVRRLLKEAMLFLDETSVLTIHSFCQKSLTEFAFETGQMFGAETLQDTTALLENEINKLWRRHIATIEKELLSHLINHNLSRSGLLSVTREHVGGKRYHRFESLETYSLVFDEKLKHELRAFAEQEKQATETMIEFVVANKEDILSKGSQNKYAREIVSVIDDPNEFLKRLYEKRTTGYAQKLFGDILEKCEAREVIRAAKADKVASLLNIINCFAIQEITQGLDDYKKLRNQLSFDDMIVKLHDALVIKDNPGLVKAIQSKYKAVFVDEFQDTDRLQYEIFQKVFSTGTILFYIGDPKQSIYAWRKADIFTYFKAYDNVDHRYGMNQNFRSSEPMIRAANKFFQPVENFDTFYFQNDEHAIRYIEVNSPAANSKGTFYKGEEEQVPVTICNGFTKSETLTAAAAAQVADLLTNPVYQLGKRGALQAVTPADIGILVRSNRQAKEIKAALAQHGIPSVTIADEKLLASGEAQYLLYLMEAMTDISRASVNKALLSPFTGFTTKDILLLDDEKTIELFRKYKARWEYDGVYTALMDFVADLNVQKILLSGNNASGDRAITNLYHLIELVSKVQNRKMFAPQELISWLKRGIEGEQMEGDEYIQRVESDEKAVRIITIHKSKGLEYPIVIAPFLDLTIDAKADTWCSYRDAASGDYIATLYKDLSTEQQTEWRKQQEQEYRRLIYVAITRAVYKCFVYKNDYGKNKSSSLAYFTNEITVDIPGLIELRPPVDSTQVLHYNKEVAWQPLPTKVAAQFSFVESAWTKMSYSSLAAKTEHARKLTSSDVLADYDQFVFRDLAKGERTGNLVHHILENVHYTKTENWENVIRAAVNRFEPALLATYQQPLHDLITHILKGTIRISDDVFTLAEVAYHKRIHEFEFDLPVSNFSTIALADLSDEVTQINVRRIGEIEGMMNGRMDLFFEHNGKYYILDWKSNYLGDNINNYSGEQLNGAMNEGNYHLQYLIYSLALKKYLETKLPVFDYEQHFGGVIYMFVRGVREGEDAGIYTCKPEWEKINALEQLLTKRPSIMI
jgi:exodeoxyribonuclease V beta subunit